MAGTTALDCQAAIVTGASSGIGEATTHALAREGSRCRQRRRRCKRFEEVADAVVFAASQEPQSMVGEMDRYRREKFELF